MRSLTPRLTANYTRFDTFQALSSIPHQKPNINSLSRSKCNRLHFLKLTVFRDHSLPDFDNDRRFQFNNGNFANTTADRWIGFRAIFSGFIFALKMPMSVGDGTVRDRFDSGLNASNEYSTVRTHDSASANNDRLLFEHVSARVEIA